MGGVPAAEREHGLVGERELLARQRVAQAPLDVQVDGHLGAQTLVEQLQPVAPRALGAIHGDVGLAQQRLRVPGGVVGDRDAHARRHAHLGGAHGERLLQSMEDPLGDHECLRVALQILCEDDELVAAQARHSVAVTHRLRQPRRDRGEDVVSERVPEVVVDRLEMVEVHEQHRDELR